MIFLVECFDFVNSSVATHIVALRKSWQTSYLCWKATLWENKVSSSSPSHLALCIQVGSSSQERTCGPKRYVANLIAGAFKAIWGSLICLETRLLWWLIHNCQTI